MPYQAGVSRTSADRTRTTDREGAVTMEDNSHAGQGPVLLDIGGEVGALILTMPAALAGQEIEIRPLSKENSAPKAHHRHAHDHAHSHADDHDHDHDHDYDHGHLIHVGVVGRPIAGEVVHSAVFSALAEGQYELYVRPDGPVMLTQTVRGGEVTMADWPTS
jgi:hypothetical protein